MQFKTPFQSLLALAITLQPYIQIAQSLYIPRSIPTDEMSIPSRSSEHPTYASIQAYLNSEQSKADTISSFTSPITSSTSSDDISDHVQGLWNSVLLIASETPYASKHQDKLVSLLADLQKQPAPSNVQYNDKAFDWRALPDFGMSAREAYNFAPSATSTETENAKWTNLNAFFARFTVNTLHTAETGAGSVGDFSLYAIWALRELENVAVEEVLEANVAAAAVWIVIAASEIKKMSEEGREYTGRVARGGDRFQEKEWKGYSVERCEAWNEDFKAFLGLSGKDESTVSLVRQAVSHLN